MCAHTSHLAYTCFTLIFLLPPARLLSAGAISARSETELGLSISCRFHGEKITKVFTARFHTRTQTLEEFSYVFPPTYYCLNIYTSNGNVSRIGKGCVVGQGGETAPISCAPSAMCCLGNICATSSGRGRVGRRKVRSGTHTHTQTLRPGPDIVT